MKNVVKYSGIIALALGLLGFILIMATPCLTFGEVKMSGIDGIFGESAQWCGTLAWIFVLISIIALVLSILPMFKVNVLEKFNRIFAIVATVLLVVAGILTFCQAAVANNDTLVLKVSLGAGWIISGILFILGGLCSILPIVVKAD